jgi:hypothetical protein
MAEALRVVIAKPIATEYLLNDITLSVTNKIGRRSSL